MEKNKVEKEWVMKRDEVTDFGDKRNQNVHVNVKYIIL